jgi:hypothetical protein
MIAYNKKGLYNMHIRKQADEALQLQYISPEERDAIFKAKEAVFYTPNFFVRIGLAILTMIIVFFVLGLFALMFGSNLNSMAFLLILVGIGCYAGAEMLISSKAHYNSGVDNMLVWMAAFLVWSGIVWQMGSGHSISEAGASLVAFVVCTLLWLRFADALLSILAAVALLCFFFYVYQHTGSAARVTAPFFMIAVSGVLCFVSGRAIKKESWVLYRSCWTCIYVVSLIALYAAGNYYLVRELSNELFHIGLRAEDALPMGWFFWTWTIIVPFVYIGMGIRNKNITLIRVGMPLIAVAVLTYRYYYAILAPEMALMVGGLLLLMISYSLINRLREPKGGFTFKPDGLKKRPGFDKILTDELIGHATQVRAGNEDASWE